MLVNYRKFWIRASSTFALIEKYFFQIAAVEETLVINKPFKIILYASAIMRCIDLYVSKRSVPSYAF